MGEGGLMGEGGVMGEGGGDGGATSSPIEAIDGA